MRKVISLLAAAGLVAGLIGVPAHAAANDRTITREYSVTSGGSLVVDNLMSPGAWVSTPWEIFRARPGEEGVSFKLQDDSGQPVLGRAKVGGRVVQFCSETQDDIPVRAGQKVAVSVITGTCDTGMSVLTEGTITTTFSR